MQHSWVSTLSFLASCLPSPPFADHLVPVRSPLQTGSRSPVPPLIHFPALRHLRLLRTSFVYPKDSLQRRMPLTRHLSLVSPYQVKVVHAVALLSPVRRRHLILRNQRKAGSYCVAIVGASRADGSTHCRAGDLSEAAERSYMLPASERLLFDIIRMIVRCAENRTMLPVTKSKEGSLVPESALSFHECRCRQHTAPRQRRATRPPYITNDAYEQPPNRRSPNRVQRHPNDYHQDKLLLVNEVNGTPELAEAVSP